jgi:ParB family chromosome partitioning protein
MFNVGKGLSSLIPKKKGDGEREESFSKDATVSSHNNETPLDSRSYSSTFGGNIARSASETLSQKSFSSREKRNKIETESVFHIEIEKIKPNPFQPRKVFSEDQIRELANSIREFGILQPLVVTKVVKETESGTEVNYQLIAGERRLIAAKILGFERVPVIIRNFEDKREKLEAALIENLQRENLNPIEEARAYARLQDDFGLTQREIAIRVGKSREVVANRLRLLKLPSDIQLALANGKINESQARVLLAASDPQLQTQAFADFANEKLRVRGLEEKIKRPKFIDPQIQYWARKLEETLGVPVKISKHGGRGKMVIQFFSDEEWRGILQKLLGENPNEED